MSTTRIKELLGRVWSPADGGKETTTAKERSSPGRQAAATPSWDELGFELYRRREGEFLVRERAAVEVQIPAFPGWVWGLVGKDEALEGVDMGQMCFLDLETTGLNLGAGGFAFTIGAGYVRDDEPVVRQYFLRDHRDERAALSDLAEFLEQFIGLVSYNGKSFDWPLLCDRFNFHRLGFPSLQEVHLDLLHAARRVWKGVLPGFSLDEVERYIVQVERGEDIPGYLIPAAYNDFLRTGSTDAICSILEHNQQDIVSLMLLGPRLAQVFLDVEYCELREEIYNAADVLARSGDIPRAIEYLEFLLQEGVAHHRVLCRLAGLYKKSGDWERAVELWQATTHSAVTIEPWVELAKYFEHQGKDFTRARFCTLKAIENSRRFSRYSSRAGDMGELQKRLQRLERKLGQQP
jgi:uncharacterized protein YprB with RNaseH-like and TPR domain